MWRTKRSILFTFILARLPSCFSRVDNRLFRFSLFYCRISKLITTTVSFFFKNSNYKLYDEYFALNDFFGIEEYVSFCDIIYSVCLLFLLSPLLLKNENKIGTLVLSSTGLSHLSMLLENHSGFLVAKNLAISVLLCI